MSTRGYVGRLNADGSVDAIYNHFDSYFNCLGKDLLNKFTTQKSVDDLITRGDGSYVLDEGPYEDAQPHHFDNLVDYEETIDNDIFLEYGYVFIEGKWYGKNHRCARQYMSNPDEEGNGCYWGFTPLELILA